jgi:CRP-like cAMP-binding protein
MALTKCELLVLERRDVLPFLERSPTACLNIMQLLCERIRCADERMSEIQRLSEQWRSEIVGHGTA